MSINIETAWYYNDEIVNEVTDMPEGTIGIVYMIMTDEGRAYIGRKSLFTTRKIKLGKRALAAMKDKRGSKVRIVTTETKWKDYTGSNDRLNKDISNGVKYFRTILHYAKTRKELTYYELRELFSNRVLEDETFYNDNISGKFFRRDIT